MGGIGALKSLMPRLLADVAACGSTLLPGWSSVATTRTAATALTITIFPRSPPVLLFFTADKWTTPYKVLVVGPGLGPDGRPVADKTLYLDLPTDMPGRD